MCCMFTSLPSSHLHPPPSHPHIFTPSLPPHIFTPYLPSSHLHSPPSHPHIFTPLPPILTSSPPSLPCYLTELAELEGLMEEYVLRRTKALIASQLPKKGTLTVDECGRLERFTWFGASLSRRLVFQDLLWHKK